jgi:hypothetical protein
MSFVALDVAPANGLQEKREVNQRVNCYTTIRGWETTVQLQRASLQAALAHGGCLIYAVLGGARTTSSSPAPCCANVARDFLISKGLTDQRHAPEHAQQGAIAP